MELLQSSIAGGVAGALLAVASWLVLFGRFQGRVDATLERLDEKTREHNEADLRIWDALDGKVARADFDQRVQEFREQLGRVDAKIDQLLSESKLSTDPRR